MIFLSVAADMAGKNPYEYTLALGINEMAWIRSHATPRMNYYRSMGNQELPEDGLVLLT